MISFSRLMTVVLALGLLGQSPVQAQKKKKKGDDAPKKEKNGEIKKLGDVTKKCAQFEGLFELYQDTVSGETFMQISEEQVGKEYIYFSHIVDGLLEAGHFRGAYGNSKIFRIERTFDNIEFRLQNTSYYFDPESAISRAADANVNQPVFMSQKIYAADEEQNKMLIKADEVFLTELFEQIKWTPPNAKPGSYFDMGKLSKEKSRMREIKNYPENTDVVVEFIYENKQPKRWGSAAVTDARYTSISYQHSLIQVPDNDFRPRFDDPRVGYFMEQMDDQTNTSATPYHDLIHRWHLKKKDPNAVLSEPVEPIVWWIENTTPKEFRASIRRGVESWNLAFEKAGFKNAVVVKEQPDDADWDAGDIRYNVLRWTSSPIPPFGGYGPSFVNPRTGQILGADVMLEFVFVTNRLIQSDIFETAAMDFLKFDEMAEKGYEDHNACHFSNMLHHSMLFGKQVLAAKGVSDVEKERFVQEGLADLALHEVGHTLGLAHNMKASNLNTPEELKDKATTASKGLTGSVMDYAPANLAPEKDLELQYFNLKPGPYDDFAIAYGYSEFPEEIETVKLKEILDRSSDPQLMFGNDADDMRGSGRGVDPRVMIFDMSSDPVQDGIQRIELVNQIIPTIKDKYTKGSQSHQELRQTWYILTGTYSNALWVMTRQIGGVHVDRSFTDQQTPNKPYQPVPRETQKKAMEALAEHAFSPEAFAFPNDLLNYIQMQRRGWNHWGNNEDPHMHDRVYYTQMSLLNQLMHKNVLKRIKDTELYGNEYPLDEYMGDLTDAIFKADRSGSVNSYRQNLQQLYTDRLIGIIAEKSRYDNFAQNMALYELNKIQRWSKSSASVGDTSTKAHRARLLHKIDQAFEG